MSKLWKRPSNILAATDLTLNSDRALERGIELARYWGARLYIVHAVDDDRHHREEIAARMKAIEAEIERKISSNPAAVDVEVEVLTTLGNPAERVLAKCDRLFIDLCLMGAGERRTLRQKLLGTTVDRVLRHAMQPVLSVRRPVTGPYRKIAIATDYLPPSLTALDCALALFPSAEATAIHAYEVALHGIFEFDRFSGPVAEQHEREMTEGVERTMTEFISGAQVAGSKLMKACEIGTPEGVLTQLAERDACDLVVVGTHGGTGIRRVVIGTVAERLLATLPCDVLAVPSPQ